MAELKTKTNRSKRIAVIVALVAMLALLTLALVGYFINTNKMATYGSSLEDVYQRSFHELVNDVNNTEIKMSKLLSSSDKSYQKKLGNELVVNTSSAQNNISVLPISVNGISETVKFINQLNGYIGTINNSLEKGDELSVEQKTTLNNLYEAVKELKYNLNNVYKKVAKGYSILNLSFGNSAEFNTFTLDMQNLKSNDVDYPTMIYDGPFAEAKMDREVKGLNFDEVSKETAQQKLQEIFEGKDLRNLKYEHYTEGLFNTYDFSFNYNGKNFYAQMSKLGGKLITLCGYNDKETDSLSLSSAKSIAVDFAKTCSIGDVEVVWNDIVGDDAYFNLAPIVNGVIYYPDLVKVKVDLASGLIMGWEASSYYSNHTDRNLGGATLGATEALEKISSDFKIISTKLCLAPLESKREVLCFEIKCEKESSTYYFYINANTGVEENILKVVKTENGDLIL